MTVASVLLVVGLCLAVIGVLFAAWLLFGQTDVEKLHDHDE